MSENHGTCANILVSCEDRVEKIDSISDTLQGTPLISRRISQQVSERCVVSDWIWGWNESCIWFSTWNFLYIEITTKYVSSENLVNFLFCYVYIKLFLALIENQYIYLVSTWSLNAWNNRVFCMKSWTINSCIILANYLVDSHYIFVTYLIKMNLLI